MDLIIVQHFYDLVELALAKRKLEEEGIATVTRDELSMQTMSIIEARAIGGAKLLVDKSEYARASKLLIELGIMNANPDPKDFWIVSFLDSIALKIPLIQQLSKEFRLIVLLFFLISIPFLLVVLQYL